MKNFAALRALTLLLALLLAIPGVAAADPIIAEVENLGDTLVFHPVTEFNELILTVSGPCDFQFRKVFDDTPFFRLDETTIDGAYRYNLVRIEAIDPSIIKILLKARQNDDAEIPKALCRGGKLPAAPIAQAEGFLVSQGKIIFDPRANEKDFASEDAGTVEVTGLKGASMPGFALKDFVINDDLIVDGSACIGFDCVNGETFGFDTIRVKENNLRIKFDDTSTAASFPRNDWQLTANDSANGGASKFSIDDISGNRTPFTVEANARSHSLYVDDGGRIGSRTSTPSTEIHTIDGDTPTLRLQQDGSSGFAPQTWDVAGNETNFFVRDVTNGSALPFRIRPGAPTSAIFVDVDGDVGLGTSSPAEELHIVRSDAGPTRIEIENTNAAGSLVGFNLTNTTEEWRVVNDGRYIMNSVSGPGNEFILEADGDLTLTGTLTITGGCTGCDAVFQPGWELESIEEHAASMWENSYLPSVGPTAEGTVAIDVFQKTTGILQELEKAHIYIEQLHAQLKSQEARLAALEGATTAGQK